MNAMTLGRELLVRRRRAGLSQAELAARVGTSQAAISRIETGRTLPSLPVLNRIALATGGPLQLVLGSPAKSPSRAERRKRVRRVLGGYGFNPWDRNPTPAEAESLIADGLTPGAAGLKGLDDLYLDRVRQATAYEQFQSVEFQSALAVGSAAYDEIDWRYVARRIARTEEEDASLGKSMKRIDSRVRREVRKALASGSPE